MNPSISIVCDATFGVGSENFGTVTGNVTFSGAGSVNFGTVNGNVTFQDGSANSGTVTGNAVFEGAAVNNAGATINGDAAFALTAVNSGSVTGEVAVFDPIADAAAFSASLNGFGNGTVGRSGVFYLGGSANGADWTIQALAQEFQPTSPSAGPSISQYRAIPSSQFSASLVSIWSINTVIDFALFVHANSLVFSPAQFDVYFPNMEIYNGVALGGNANAGRMFALNADKTPYSGTLQTGENFLYTDENGNSVMEPIYFQSGGANAYVFVNGR